MATIEEAERDVLAKWLTWSVDRPGPTGNDVFIFYGWLQRNDPAALDFPREGDPWQTVHAWIRHGDPRVRDLTPDESSARLLIEQYGEDAEDHASEQVAAMMVRGDMDAVTTWRAILDAIEWLRKCAQVKPAH